MNAVLENTVKQSDDLNDEIEYRFVRGQGWVAGYKEKDQGYGRYRVRYGTDGALHVTFEGIIHTITITGTVSV